MWLQVINTVKFIHQGEGHIKVKVKYLHPFRFYVAHTFCKRVVCIQLNAFLFSVRYQSIGASGVVYWVFCLRVLVELLDCKLVVLIKEQKFK